MFQPTIKLNRSLYEKVKQCAAAAGYSSPEEFVEHVLEREVAKQDESVSDEEVVKKMQGLGYID
ncbi:MAG: hypothetical protein C5B51_04285 [Terriglobia bacterium]|nr:MAG: hypothetical protein C5B51_04285 [Terriglobia bacterium]